MSTILNHLGETNYNNNNNNTNNNNNNILDKVINEKERRGTPIQEFYMEQKVLITGGTGFLGKILIEKLLRSCPGISFIYLLIRSKKEKNAKARIEELFEDCVFDRMKKEVPKYRDKIVAVCGDCGVEKLGLSTKDRKMLENEVSIVFHVAATVRFNEKLKLATVINVRSTNDLLEMCKSMPKLKALVHVSTAYANCFEKQIEERFYKYSVHHEELLRLTETLSEEELENKYQNVTSKWPNMYTFTKAMAESLIKEKHGNLPIGIVRPAIVISTAYEPIEGWLDNIYGPNGITAAASSGILRVMYCDSAKIADIIPVDITVNAIIASAWDITMHTNRKGDDMLIYNVVASTEAPLTWDQYHHICYPYIRQYPSSNMIWYPTLITTKNKLLYNILSFIFQTLPATLIDIILFCLGKKPRMRKTINKINNFVEILSFFCTRNWVFVNDNVHNMWTRLNSKDQQLFRFSMANFDWQLYLHKYMKGIRTYLFKENKDTLESSQLKLKRLYWIHHIFKILFYLGGFWTIFKIFCKIFPYPSFHG